MYFDNAGWSPFKDPCYTTFLEAQVLYRCLIKMSESDNAHKIYVTLLREVMVDILLVNDDLWENLLKISMGKCIAYATKCCIDVW